MSFTVVKVERRGDSAESLALDGASVRWNADHPQFTYPPAGCTGSDDCPSCPLYQCPNCKEMNPWCCGADDELGEWCDECAQRATREAAHNRAPAARKRLSVFVVGAAGTETVLNLEADQC